MANQSWRQYGGINKPDMYQYLTVGTLVANQIFIREVFTVFGSIIVTQDADISMNVNVGKDVNAFGNINAFGNLISYQNAFIQNDTYTSNAYINNKLYFGTGNNGTTIYPDTGQYSYIYGNSINGTFGINTTNPQYLLDINGTSSISNEGKIFSIRTDASNIHNVLARTIQDSGITIDSDVNTTSIGFYSGNTITSGIPSATIQSISGGNMLLNGTNIQFGSHLAISQTGVYDTISGEPVTIYGNPIHPYMIDYFNDSSIRSGTALTLVATDNSSSTFLNITTPNQTGISIGGGALMGNTSTSFGTIGFNRINGTYIQTQNAYTNGNIIYNDTRYENIYIPSQTIVNGNNNIKNKSTLGINTYYPKTNEYVLDINGPTHIGHGELSSILHTTYQILSMKCSKTNPLTAISVGTATLLDKLIYNPLFSHQNNNYYYNYAQNISFTKNGGKTWTTIQIGFGTIDIGPPLNLCLNVFDSSYAFIASNTTLLFYTYNGGLNWNQINANTISVDDTNTITTRITYNFKCLYTYIFSDTFRIVSGGIKIVNVIDVSNNTYNSTSNQSIIYIDIPKNTTSEISSFYKDTNSSLLSIKDCDGFSNIVCFVGAGIQVYDISNNISLLTYKTNQQYNSVYVYNENYAIAVGTNIISFTTNGLTYWSDVPVSKINGGIFQLKNVYIYNDLQALAVGDNGVFLYTLNGSLTWENIPNSILNTSGIGNRLTDVSNQLQSIFMPDANSFVVSKTLSTFSDIYYNSIDPSNVSGKSNILYGYYPNLFNRSNHKVLDVSGNMVITGDIGVDSGNINVAGNIQGNSLLHIMGDSVLESRLLVRGNTSLNGNVFIAGNTLQNGDVTMNSRLFVLSDVSLNRKVFVNEDAHMNSSLFVKKNTVQYGDVSMNSRLFVSSDVLLNKRLYVNADASFNSRLFIGSDIFIGNDLYITGNTILKSGLSIYSDTVLNGNVYLGSRTIQQGDVSMNSKLFVGSDASFNQNVYISAKTTNQGDVSMNSRLYVNGDSSFNGNVYIGSNTIQQGDVSMNSKLFVQSDASFNAKLFVRSDMNVYSGLMVGKDTSFNGNVYVGSNTIQNGNVTMNSNVMVKQNAIILGNVNCSSDINIIGNIYTDSTIYSNNYDSKINENTIFIGSKNTNRTINIGYGGNLSNSNIINIGNPNDTIVIHGTTTSATQAVTAQKYFVANKDNPINGSSYGGGLLIYDNNNDYAGYTILSQDMTGFLFKATQSSNVVRLDVKSMVLPNVSVNGPPNASILFIVPSTDLQSNYTVTTNNSLYLDSNGNFHSNNKSMFHTDISGMGNFSILGNTNLNNTVIQSNNDGPALQMNGIMVSNSPIFQF